MDPNAASTLTSTSTSTSTSTLTQIWALCDELAEAHGELLPQAFRLPAISGIR